MLPAFAQGNRLKAAVSGSFHRHMGAIYSAVGELRDRGVNVLSPSDPRVVDFAGEFLFVASDKTRLTKQVQQRHFSAIDHADFLWLVCPDGYVGVSAAMEVAWATKSGVPIFSDRKPLDLTLQDFVVSGLSIQEAAATVQRRVRTKRPPSMLLEPEEAARLVVSAAEETRDILTGRVIALPKAATLAIKDNAELVKDVFRGLEDERRDFKT